MTLSEERKLCERIGLASSCIFRDICEWKRRRFSLGGDEERLNSSLHQLYLTIA